jgi:hypothetical protein
MIVHDLHLERISVLESKGDPPGAIHFDRPLALAVPREPMKSDTAKRRKVIERGGAVELRQTLPRERFVEAGKTSTCPFRRTGESPFL